MSGRQDFIASRHGVISTVSPIDLSRTRRTRSTFAQSGIRRGATLGLRPAGGWLILDHRFVHEHHRNVVLYWVDPPALRTFQPAGVRFQLHLHFANRAGEYLEKFRAYWHTAPPGTYEREV